MKVEWRQFYLEKRIITNKLMLKAQKEQKKMLEELASQNSSLRLENYQLRNEIDSLHWKINDLSSR